MTANNERETTGILKRGDTVTHRGRSYTVVATETAWHGGRCFQDIVLHSNQKYLVTWLRGIQLDSKPYSARAVDGRIVGRITRGRAEAWKVER